MEGQERERVVTMFSYTLQWMFGTHMVCMCLQERREGLERRENCHVLWRGEENSVCVNTSSPFRDTCQGFHLYFMLYLTTDDARKSGHYIQWTYLHHVR